MNKQQALDTIVTAAEGGSNYWADFPDYHGPKLLDGRIDRVTVVDRETGNRYRVHWTLIRDALANTTHPAGIRARAAIETDSADAEDADVALQWATLGELIYG